MLEKLQKCKFIFRLKYNIFRFLKTFLILANDIPPQKLAALQKVLQSDFFNAVREVYEHIYHTIESTGTPELRASATAKVCLIFKIKFK